MNNTAKNFIAQTRGQDYKVQTRLETLYWAFGWMKIKAIIECFHSRPDFYGNINVAFNYMDCETGKSVKATISGGESNIRGISHDMGLKYDEYYYTSVEMSIRQYNAFVKKLPYAGCNTQTELVPFIKKNLE